MASAKKAGGDEDGVGEEDDDDDEHVHASALGTGEAGVPSNPKDRARDAKAEEDAQSIAQTEDDFDAPSPRSSALKSSSGVANVAAGKDAHKRSRSMSLMIGNVAAGGGAGGPTQAGLLAGKDSPRFGPAAGLKKDSTPAVHTRTRPLREVLHISHPLIEWIQHVVHLGL